MRWLIAIITVAVLLQGACGRKGPLELPAVSGEASGQIEEQEKEKHNDTH